MKRFSAYQQLRRAMERKRNPFRFLPEHGPAEFKCSVCKQWHAINTPGNGGTGYAVTSGDSFAKPNFICYPCTGEREKADMIEAGRLGNKFCLYLVCAPADSQGYCAAREVTNWPNTLRFPVKQQQPGQHNMARRRIDVWFNGPDGYVWHGIQYGENTQICHCYRTKEKSNA